MWETPDKIILKKQSTESKQNVQVGWNARWSWRELSDPVDVNCRSPFYTMILLIIDIKKNWLVELTTGNISRLQILSVHKHECISTSTKWLKLHYFKHLPSPFYLPHKASAPRLAFCRTFVYIWFFVTSRQSKETSSERCWNMSHLWILACVVSETNWSKQGAAQWAETNET